jgi:hypothetical protein
MNLDQFGPADIEEMIEDAVVLPSTTKLRLVLMSLPMASKPDWTLICRFMDSSKA